MLREMWRGREGRDLESCWLRKVWDMDFGCLIV
jgi:hypothetical protein